MTLPTILGIVLAVLLALLVLYAFMTFPGKRRPISPELLGAQYAHRGLHDAEHAENSLSAFALAVKNGYDVIFCQCPMRPKSDCEHIIIPEVGLALITVKKEHNISLECDRLIHCKRFLREETESYSQRLRRGKKLCSHLIGESINSLKNAKETHDRLEKEYIEVMDFHGLNDYTDIITEEMFSIYT